MSFPNISQKSHGLTSHGSKATINNIKKTYIKLSMRKMTKFRALTLTYLTVMILFGNALAQNRIETCKGDSEQWSNCFGVIKYPDGNRYAGRFSTGKFLMGTYTHSTGETYTGRYKNNEFNGLGTYVFPSGEMYIGQWKNNEFTGQGLTVEAGTKIVMIKVINACDSRNMEDFPDVAGCIKRSYQRVGTVPSGQNTKNFYSLLDGVMEDFNKGNFGLAKAKAEIIKAWQSTIDASNKREQDSATIDIANRREQERQANVEVERASRIKDCHTKKAFEIAMASGRSTGEENFQRCMSGLPPAPKLEVNCINIGGGQVRCTSQ